jgi:hypothetical protein
MVPVGSGVAALLVNLGGFAVSVTRDPQRLRACLGSSGSRKNRCCIDVYP